MNVGSKEIFDAKAKPYISEIEYLKSNGTQTIDTGIVRNIANDYRIVIEFEYENTTDRQLHGVQGFVYVGCISGHIQAGNMSTGFDSAKIDPKQKYLIDIHFLCRSASCSYSINGSQQFSKSCSYENNPVGATFHVFSLNDMVLPSVCKVFKFELFENSTKVCDFIPVRFTNENGQTEGAMYDRSSGQLFHNVGTGAFVIGPDKK